MARLRILSYLVLISTLFLTNSALGNPSTIANGELTIPRVDIDDYGPLQLNFAVVFDNEYFFDLTETFPASESTANSAVFDPLSMELEIFEIELENGDLYTARLGLVSQNGSPTAGFRFRLLEAQQIDNDDPIIDPPPDNAAAQAMFGQLCASCHGADGQGTAIAASLSACANCSDGTLLANYIRDTMPLGSAANCDANCALLMSDYILAEFNADNAEVSQQTIGFIELLSSTNTVRKAAMKLASRLPTLEEYQQANESGNPGLTQVIDNLMSEEAFYQRLSEIFNDYLFTDKYLSRNDSEGAIRLLDRTDFPQTRWFDPGSENRTDIYETQRRHTNDGIAREPLELINYVVRNNLPLTEILTADYIMVNPYSARSYGIDNIQFADENDPTEFQPGQISNIPHAGILTSPMFLNRYPTTSTNRNRARARVVFDIFLDTDILAIEGVRPGNAVDITTPIPTIDNTACSKCHSVLDPVAAVFQNWDYKGRYRPSRLERYGWYPDMDLRGFNGEIMPLSGNVDSSVQWLGQKMAQDPKFPRAMVRILLRGLTGKEPLRAPVDNATQQQIDAYIAERTLLNDIQQQFVSDNYNLKTLVRGIVLSPYWRAEGLTDDADLAAHSATGSQQLLSPEQLDRKIEALLGFEWRGSLDNYHYDITKTWASKLGYRFHQIYGGINSDSITKRLTSANGLMGAMQLRMANELACYAVPNEFMIPVEQRRLLPFVNINTSPYDTAGNIDANAMQLIRQNIQYLHDYLLAEYYPLGHEELQITEALFMSSLNKGRQEIIRAEGNWSVVALPAYCRRTRDIAGNSLYPEGGQDDRLLKDPQYLMRSWMAVVAYLLADYQFIYE